MKPAPASPAAAPRPRLEGGLTRLRPGCKSYIAGRALNLALALLAGCAVGPDFKRPAAPPVKSYTADPLQTTASTTNVTGGEAQRFVEGLDIPARWWALFHSKPLNDL